VVITLVTIGLLFAGNFAAMQTMVVLAGLPFSVVLILFMFGLHKAMRQDAQMELEQAELAARGRRGFFSERLTAQDLQPTQAVVQRFMDKHVTPGAGRSGRAFAQSRPGRANPAGQSQALHGRAG
jgi:choline/glycine/proline betaine transport protein